MMGSSLKAQALVDARSLGLGGSLGAVRDTRDFAANPAGLVHMRDWDMSVSTYAEPSNSKSGFVFQGLALGKRLSEQQAAALRYTPGSSVSFVIPPVLLLGESNLPESADREIEYQEPFAFGIAHKFADEFSAGIGIRYRRERVADTRYQIIVRDTISYPTATQETFTRNAWLADAALQWQPSDQWSLTIAGRNVLRMFSGDAADVLETYRLPSSTFLEGGVRYTPDGNIHILASASSAGMGTVGAEWSPGLGLTVRGSVMGNKAERPMLCAAGMGIGWSYEFFEVDAGYLHYLSAENHRGNTPITDFSADDIINLDQHPFSRNRLALTAKAIFGHVRASLARIEGITMSGGVYPASHEVFAYKPIGTVRVRNVSSQPIHAKASFFVDRLMDAPTESAAVYILPDGVAEIPLTAVFNEQVKRVSTLTVKDGNVFVNATPAEQYDDKAQTRVLIHGKNAWDGDVNTLRYFVTPDEPLVLKYSRDALLEQRDSLEGIPGMLEQFTRARLVISSFAGRLQYVSDPRLTADFVQYPVETLNVQGGDCDDMTVCFASLLSSIGIATAFVDVIPPGKPDQAHIYLLFDTGVEPRFASALAENPKRFVVRRGPRGKETLWIPIETTVIARGFDEAWTGGAQRYFDDVEIGLGLAHGWVRVVDVN
ncbi:MAG: hypothetical protein IT282_03695 [Bacteroidetes bacterium]|nr:hypothetical protein [Bacteroidota bacterium]